jgi:hypothetical protein
VRARLAAAGEARQRAEGVPVEGLFHMRGSVGRSTTLTTCARTDDGFYCLSDDGRWGWRIPFAAGAPPQPGDLVLAAAPCLVNNGIVLGNLAGWLVSLVPTLPSEGLVLQVQGGSLAWVVAVPNADEWYGALMLALQSGGTVGPAATS